MPQVFENPTRSQRLARGVNDVLAPWNLAVIMPPILGALTTDPAYRGALLGLVVSILGGVVPAFLLWRGIRKGRYQDRFIVRREDRPRFLMTVVGLISVAWLVDYFLGASRTLLGFIALMVLMAAVATVVSRWWKISIHAILVAASVSVLTMLEPRLAPLLLLDSLIVWSRRVVRAHTVTQLLAGAAVGSLFGVAAGLL